jgi:hypothetical protein
MVGTGAIAPPSAGKNVPVPGGLALAGILETSAGIDFGAMVRITGEALTRSDKDAQGLVDVIRFMTTMMRNASQNNPKVAKFESVLNNLDVRAVGTAVKLTVAVPEADLEQWIKPGKTKTQQASVN